MHRETTRTKVVPNNGAPSRDPSRIVQDPDKLVTIESLLPWETHQLAVRPYKDMWSFNPSIHYDGTTWRCVVRCADYAMPDGNVVRAEGVTNTKNTTKNAMVILDPRTWQPQAVFPMTETHNHPIKRPCSYHGFEDMRLFSTKSNGLQGVACSLQLAGEKSPPHPEQVLLSFSAKYEINKVQTIRGAWSNRPQKNWSPFDNTDDPRFLFSLDKGLVYDQFGPLYEQAPAMPPINAQPRAVSHGGPEITIRRKSITLPSGSTGGRPGYGGLRGGGQLVQIAPDRWLSIGHDMRFYKGKKLYWHNFYTVDDSGQMIARSPAMKIAREGIEFAAGLAIEGGRVVVSYGVDDMHCRIGITDLEQVLSVLRPLHELVEVDHDDAPVSVQVPELPSGIHGNTFTNTVAAVQPFTPARRATVAGTSKTAPVVPLQSNKQRMLSDREVATLPIETLRKAYVELRDRVSKEEV